MADDNVRGYDSDSFNPRRQYEIHPSMAYNQPQYGENVYVSEATPQYHQTSTTPPGRHAPGETASFPATTVPQVNSAYQYQYPNFVSPAYEPQTNSYNPPAAVPYVNAPGVFGTRIAQMDYISRGPWNGYCPTAYPPMNVNRPFDHLSKMDNENRETASDATENLEITAQMAVGKGLASSPSSSSQLEDSPRQQVTCQFCQKTLTGPHAPGNLTRHQKSKECKSDRERKEYPCSIPGCGRKYTRSDGLLNHQRKVHNAPGPIRRNVTDMDGPSGN